MKIKYAVLTACLFSVALTACSKKAETTQSDTQASVAQQSKSMETTAASEQPAASVATASAASVGEIDKPVFDDKNKDVVASDVKPQ